MFESMFWYLFICLLFFGIGDFLGVATKAKLSAVFVSLMLFLFAFMTGLIPPDIIKKAGLDQIAKWSVLFLVFSMGTTINVRELIDEWRTVVTAFLAMGVIMLAAFLMMPLIGYEETIVSVPIVTGGIVATQIMTEAAMNQASPWRPRSARSSLRCRSSWAPRLRATSGFAKRASSSRSTAPRAWCRPLRRTRRSPPGEPKPTFFERHKKYYGSFTSLAITAFFAWLAWLLGKNTGLAATIWALILGAVVGTTGMLPKNILKHANAAGIFNCAVFGAIIPSLATIKPGDLLTLSYSIVIIFVISIAVILLFFYVLPLWKILGSRNVAVGVASCQLLGFPATYLIANEVINAVAENEVEKKIISDRLMPKYLVAGFATVTSFSVIIAGIFVEFL